MNSNTHLYPKVKEAIATMEIEGFRFTDEEVTMLQSFVEQGLSAEEQLRAVHHYLDRVEHQPALHSAE